MTVLLATCEEWPEGEPGAAADLVAVRSTWDCIHRPDDLLAWARRVESTTLLLNGADVFGWNVDNAYLTGLGDVPVVPTVSSTPGSTTSGCAGLRPRRPGSRQGAQDLAGGRHPGA